MISFECKQCGKRFERPDETAGTLVFCGCGTGNRVPWESTIPAPERQASPALGAAERPPRVLPAEPIDESRPERQRPPRRWAEVRERNPAYCLNHEDLPSEQKCADCEESFCAGCVVLFQGQMLCGPCKNHRLRRLEQPARISLLALLSLIGAIMSGGVAFFLVLFGIGAAEMNPGRGGLVVFLGIGALAFLVQFVILMLAMFGLRDVESHPRVRGRAMALSALTTVLGSTILLSALAFLYLRSVL